MSDDSSQTKLSESPNAHDMWEGEGRGYGGRERMRRGDPTNLPKEASRMAAKAFPRGNRIPRVASLARMTGFHLFLHIS